MLWNNILKKTMATLSHTLYFINQSDTYVGHNKIYVFEKELLNIQRINPP